MMTIFCFCAIMLAELVFMKIMSFNTQHCKNYLENRIDYPIMADAIVASGADIVGLNEMYDEGDDERYVAQTAILSELTGLKYHYFAKAIDWRGNNPYGNALLSRYPILQAETVVIPAPVYQPYPKNYETRSLLKATLENGLTVLVTHFGLNPDEQQNAVEAVLEGLKAEKCILMGDFNVLPDDPVLAPIRARMKDAAAWFQQPLLSFPSDEPFKKIDYIFVSSDIEVVAADIPEIIASDHRPHTATVSIPDICCPSG